MDESVAPWRALEDPTASADASPADQPRAQPSLQVMATLGAAATLIAVAFWVAASSNGGAVHVEGAFSAEDPASSMPAARRTTGASGAELIADVQGAVVRPGIVHLPAGSRVGDAIAAAGGFGPRVAAERVGRELNLAALVRDGDQIVVPSRDDPPSGAAQSAGPGAGPATGPLDLNRATATELDALPGIGPVTANKIIAARDEQPFTSVDDLRTRKILGSSTFEKIKHLVTVR